MSALSVSFTPRTFLRLDFAPEWCGIGAILLLDLIWAPVAGLHIGLAWHDGLVLALAFAVMLVLRGLAIERGGLMTEYFALTVAATTAFGVLSYLCTAHAAPFADGLLQRIDAALGFDWLRWFRMLFAHPNAAIVFKFCYDSLVYQGLYFGLLLALLDRKPALREMFWVVFAAGIFTSAGAFLWPALGPFKQFGFESHGDYIPVIEHLRSGHDLNFALHDMTGVVSFPSFHTTMAIAYTYGFRRTGVIGIAVAAINCGMLLAIPFFGGHYLIDMIAGAAVMLASLGVVKTWPMLSRMFRAPESPLRQSAVAN